MGRAWVCCGGLRVRRGGSFSFRGAYGGREGRGYIILRGQGNRGFSNECPKVGTW